MQRNVLEVSNDILSEREIPNYYLSKGLMINLQLNLNPFSKRIYDIAIIREEGSNGDKEMAAAFYNAGFQPWDVHMNDLMKNPGILHRFRGIALVGGFSFSDVLGAGKGWEKSIKSNAPLYQSFLRFYNREDTFSLGVCNGCQLMCNLNWVDGKMSKNDSNMFESRFSTVKIQKTNVRKHTKISNIELTEPKLIGPFEPSALRILCAVSVAIILELGLRMDAT